MDQLGDTRPPSPPRSIRDRADSGINTADLPPVTPSAAFQVPSLYHHGTLSQEEQIWGDIYDPENEELSWSMVKNWSPNDLHSYITSDYAVKQRGDALSTLEKLWVSRSPSPLGISKSLHVTNAMRLSSSLKLLWTAIAAGALKNGGVRTEDPQEGRWLFGIVMELCFSHIGNTMPWRLRIANCLGGAHELSQQQQMHEVDVLRQQCLTKLRQKGYLDASNRPVRAFSSGVVETGFEDQFLRVWVAPQPREAPASSSHRKRKDMASPFDASPASKRARVAQTAAAKKAAKAAKAKAAQQAEVEKRAKAQREALRLRLELRTQHRLEQLAKDERVRQQSSNPSLRLLNVGDDFKAPSAMNTWESSAAYGLLPDYRAIYLGATSTTTTNTNTNSAANTNSNSHSNTGTHSNSHSSSAPRSNHNSSSNNGGASGSGSGGNHGAGGNGNGSGGNGGSSGNNGGAPDPHDGAGGDQLGPHRVGSYQAASSSLISAGSGRFRLPPLPRTDGILFRDHLVCDKDISNNITLMVASKKAGKHTDNGVEDLVELMNRPNLQAALSLEGTLFVLFVGVSALLHCMRVFPVLDVVNGWFPSAFSGKLAVHRGSLH